MPLRIRRRSQRAGVLIYIAGLAVYFASWLVLIVVPASAWSRSAAGFLAPSYTPLIWALGIALIGDTLSIRVPYRWWFYLLAAILFTLFHLIHTAIVYLRVM